jgi:hypothetical protein
MLSEGFCSNGEIHMFFQYSQMGHRCIYKIYLLLIFTWFDSTLQCYESCIN